MANNQPLLISDNTVDHLFRQEAGKMVAVLARELGFGQVSVAEDIVQDTLLTALESWKLQGMPDQPRAWLYRVARNKLLNHLKRERHFNDQISPQVAYQTESEHHPQALDHVFLDHEIEDAQLRMMFACCHPALPTDVQLIMMLKTLCGLSVREIAAALLSHEDAIAKRLYRAKERIKSDQIALEVPVGLALGPRLEAVLQAIYLMFNEAYKSASSDQIIRREICYDALRMGHLLLVRPPQVEGYDTSAISALMALMYFHTARFDGRLDASGQIVLLEHQDRTKWSQPMIQQAYQYFRDSQGHTLTHYHLEAGIASYHAQAARFEDTNWQGIYYCYHLLYELRPSPIVAFNKAIALGYHEGPKAGIAALLEITELNQNYLYLTALGDFYARLEQPDKAREAYLLALKCADLATERTVISTKIEALGS
jgi:RNA polymerase sigma factor (sigma-70 family)